MAAGASNGLRPVQASSRGSERTPRHRRRPRTTLVLARPGMVTLNGIPTGANPRGLSGMNVAVNEDRLRTRTARWDNSPLSLTDTCARGAAWGDRPQVSMGDVCCVCSPTPPGRLLLFSEATPRGNGGCAFGVSGQRCRPLWPAGQVGCVRFGQPTLSSICTSRLCLGIVNETQVRDSRHSEAGSLMRYSSHSGVQCFERGNALRSRS